MVEIPGGKNHMATVQHAPAHKKHITGSKLLSARCADIVMLPTRMLSPSP